MRRISSIDGARAFAMLMLAGMSGQAQPAVSERADRQKPEGYTISVSVDLVVLHATVRDRQGRLVSGLGEQDFALYEDGVRQSVRLFQHEDLPVTVGLVIDHSGSIRTKLPEVIAAARAFVYTSNSADRLFVVNFNEKVTLGMREIVPFADRTFALERAISLTPAAGMTALYDAVAEGLTRLQPANADRGVLIAISDGGDNASHCSLAQVVEQAAKSSTMIYAIGIADESDPDRNPAALRRLASTTGGEAFFPGDSTQVTAICERIAHDIRNQYTLGYVSSNASKRAAYRTVHVVASDAAKEKLSVRARTGYYPAPGAVRAKQESAK
jgi:Ca-activated chloride channel family protein